MIQSKEKGVENKMGLLDGIKEWAEERRQAKVDEIKACIDKEIVILSRKTDQLDNYDLKNDPFAKARMLKIEKAYINVIFNKYRHALWKFCGPEEIARMKEEGLKRLQDMKKELEAERGPRTSIAEIEQTVEKQKAEKKEEIKPGELAERNKEVQSLRSL